MSVNTEFVEKRNLLEKRLIECEKIAREMLDPDMWGAKDWKDDYPLRIYQAIREAQKKIFG